MIIQKKVEAFKKKLRILKAWVYYGNFNDFAIVSEFLEEDITVKYENISESVNEHLIALENSFDKYFPEDLRINNEWIENPVTVDIMTIHILTDIEDQLIELSCDDKL